MLMRGGRSPMRASPNAGKASQGRWTKPAKIGGSAIRGRSSFAKSEKRARRNCLPRKRCLLAAGLWARPKRILWCARALAGCGSLTVTLSKPATFSVRRCSTRRMRASPCPKRWPPSESSSPSTPIAALSRLSATLPRKRLRNGSRGATSCSTAPTILRRGSSSTTWP